MNKREYRGDSYGLDIELTERVRDLVFWIGIDDPSITMKEFIEEAIEHNLEYYYKRNGGRFPRRPYKGNPRSGRAAFRKKKRRRAL